MSPLPQPTARPGLTSRRPKAARALAPLLAAAAVAAPATAPAQGAAAQQKVTGPVARYWMTADTVSGLGLPGMGSMGGGANESGGGLGAMAGLIGGMMRGNDPYAPRRTLRLELGGPAAPGIAEAQHAIPAAMGLPGPLPLLGPEPGSPPRREPVERDVPEMPQDTPKGRMLFFWGCGENAGAGQPVVVDFAQVAQGVVPEALRSMALNLRAVRQGPSAARDRGFAEWPNRNTRTEVPATASLVGDHVVRGNFTPEIRFSVAAANDFMEPVSLRQAPASAGSQQLEWNRPATATGYFASAMGMREDKGNGGDIVFWNSSSARLLGGDALHAHLPPAEVERLVKAGAVLPRETTRCTVPRQAVEAAGGTLMLVNLSAYGPELNLVHPPRPEDPKVTWEQQWAVKLRQRASTSLLGGMDRTAEARPRRDAEPSSAAASAPGAAVKDQVKSILNGLFGR